MTTPRAVSLAISIAAATAGVFLCLNYPIAPAMLVVAFALWSAAVYLRPSLWLAIVPALVPIVGFASWTGWLTFEELDVLVLGVAAGGYARRVLADGGTWSGDPRRDGGDPAARLSVVPFALIVLFAASSAIALHRGIHDAGGFQWGWFQGYYDPLNSLRVAKGFALALLVAPLLFVELRRNRERAIDLLSIGFAIGGMGAALSVVWERVAFTGLLNFSTDYRATGLFWETHVGGAALDGFLALTVPFAVRMFLRASTPREVLISAIFAGAASYACLVTFSRGVYLAIPVALVLLMVLLRAQDNASRPIGVPRIVGGVALCIVGIVVFHLTFRAGGYRTLAAMLGVFALSIPLSEMARKAAPVEWVLGIAGGIVLGAAGVVVASVLPKGAYIVYAAAFAFGLMLAWRHSIGQGSARAMVALAAHGWVLVAAVNVARYWGGEAALADALIAAGVLIALAIVGALSGTSLWHGSLRARGAMVGSATLLAGIVATFSGGAYMGDRFGAIGGDLGERFRHWTNGISYLQGPGDWVLGKGLGRFPASYFYGVRDGIHPGSYRLATEDGRPYLALSGPTYPISFGDAFRVSQRVAARPGHYKASFEARAAQDARIHLEICEKHLLYGENCAISTAPVAPSGSRWVHFDVPLEAFELTGGHWYAPRLAFFAVALETSGRRVEIRDLALFGPDGRSAVANGDFGNGMAHWFITSDRYHLPWHIKNMPLAVLFDQGVAGLVLLSMLIVVALLRLAFGRASAHPVAPYFAASLAGFLVVGMFDSLLDVPRDGFLFYLLLLSSLALRANPRDAQPPPPT